MWGRREGVEGEIHLVCVCPRFLALYTSGTLFAVVHVYCLLFSGSAQPTSSHICSNPQTLIF